MVYSNIMYNLRFTPDAPHTIIGMQGTPQCKVSLLSPISSLTRWATTFLSFRCSDFLALFILFDVSIMGMQS